ncbi:hypothetical protein LTS10_012872 [Elasticomyces elasticus]|nr:hypothetical protein LTS10_012872 [Elasticomyces elasticus]
MVSDASRISQGHTTLFPSAGRAGLRSTRTTIGNSCSHLWLALADGLAYAEKRLIIAKMLWHLDFDLALPNEDWHDSLRAFMGWKRTPMRKRSMPVER